MLRYDRSGRLIVLFILGILNLIFQPDVLHSTMTIINDASNLTELKTAVVEVATNTPSPPPPQPDTTHEISNRSITIPTSPILFVHFHKSGGTSVCKTMKQQTFVNMTNADGSLRNKGDDTYNCNIPGLGPMFHAKQHKSQQDCASLIPFARNQTTGQARHNFMAVEVPLRQALPCGDDGEEEEESSLPLLRTFAIMRRPVARVLSHMQEHRLSAAKVTNFVQQHAPHAKKSFVKNGYPAFNNLVIRQLLGRDVYSNHTRSVDDQDLERAKLRVDAFDAFVLLEYLDHVAIQSLLRRVVPEYYLAEKVTGRVRNQKRPLPSEEFLKLMQYENRYDIMLYQYTLERFNITPTENDLRGW